MIKIKLKPEMSISILYDNVVSNYDIDYSKVTVSKNYDDYTVDIDIDDGSKKYKSAVFNIGELSDFINVIESLSKFLYHHKVITEKEMKRRIY